MKLKTYILLKTRFEQKAEKAFIVRIKRALNETMRPLFEAVQLGTLTSEDQANTLIKSEYIARELKWLYVTWGFKMLKWFRSSYNPKDVKSFDWMQRLEEWFELNGADKVTAIYTTTIEKTKELIRIALPMANSGKSIDEIQKAIKAEIRDSGGVISDSRARTIARTEVVGASENATYQAMAAENLNVEKLWTTGGENIRESHLAAEAEGWVPFDHVYRVASNSGFDEMKHPHDVGSAENVVNCKCTLLFRVVD